MHAHTLPYTPHAWSVRYPHAIQENFNIFYGKANSKFESDQETTLSIQYIVYETLVKGIHAASQRRDFKGALLSDYELDGEKYYIVFAMWYSQIKHIYFLTSLGQYSLSEFSREMKHFKVANENRLKIKLGPIHREGLANLKHKLMLSNLSGANVCLVEDTIKAQI